MHEHEAGGDLLRKVIPRRRKKKKRKERKKGKKHFFWVGRYFEGEGDLFNMAFG